LISPKRNFWVVFILLGVSTLAAAVWGTSIYYRLIYLWALLILTSLVWSFLSLRRITIRRNARTLRQQVGQIFEERFEVTNPNRFARLWIAVKDESNLPGAAGSRLLTWIHGRQERMYLSYTWLTRRGLFTLGPTILESGDLFGLFESRLDFSSAGSLLVTPYLVDLQQFPGPPGLLPGGRALHRKALEVTPYAAGVREYVPGDSLNRIHWPTTARRDRLMVKEFEQDPQADVWIFLDAQKSVQAALQEATQEDEGERFWLWKTRPDEVTLPPATIEYAVSIAASVSLYYIKKGRAVGFACASQVYTILPAERSERQLGKILDTLAFIEGEGNLPLVGLTSMQATFLPRGSTVVMITPSNQQSVVLAAEDLERRNLKPVVVILDALSFGGVMDSKPNATMLSERRITTIVVSNGSDLKSSLEFPEAGQALKPAWAVQPVEI